MRLNELKNIIQKEIKLLLKEGYNFDDWVDENQLSNYIWLGELLNPQNSFEYEGDKGHWEYKDTLGNVYFVKLLYQPTKDPYFEFKTGYFGDNGKPQYNPPIHPNSTGKDWDKRSDTVAKIWRDEVISLFLGQNKSNKLVLKPLDIKRYQFWIRLVKKFPLQNTKIIEKKPTQIIILKNE